jgi:organic radical activating enzyme
MTDNKTYCKYFWSHIALFNGKTATPCCRYDHSNKTGGSTINRQKKFTTFTETIHSPEWEELRRKAIEGEKEPGCWKCYEEEERGNKSLRNIANDMDFNDDNELKLTYLEINLGNYCNLACNICCSDNSNLWYEDDKKLKSVGIYKRGTYEPDHKEGISLNLEDYVNVRLIKFVGGEPMIHPKFITLLDFLIEHGLQSQIQIQVFTNGSWVPKEKIKDRLKQFKNVTISLSIDGVGQVNDYSRWPSKWSVVHESAKMWLTMSKENENIKVRWEPTLSIYNVISFTEAIQWWIETSIDVLQKPFHEAVYNEELDDINMILNNVMWPEYMTPNLIPNKEQVCIKLDYFIEKIYNLYLDTDVSRSKHMLKRLDYNIQELKRHISNPIDENHLRTFIHFSYDLDKQRNNSLPEQLPRLWDQIKSFGEYSTLKT